VYWRGARVFMLSLKLSNVIELLYTARPAHLATGATTQYFY